MAIRNTRPARASTEQEPVAYGTMGREADTGAIDDVRHGLRWLLGGVLAFFLGVVLGEVWPSATGGLGDARQRTAHVAPYAQQQPVTAEVIAVGSHRLAVPSHLLSSSQVSAARQSRGGFVTHLAWADPENPSSEASRRCIEARPRCRDSFTMVISTTRTPAERQWADARRRLAPIGGGEAYGLRFHTAVPGPDGRAGPRSNSASARPTAGRSMAAARARAGTSRTRQPRARRRRWILARTAC
ncbi:MAG: hypothetical protein IRZ13_11495 [Acetobacteraceae bacterium]|nr:hypothetical protein [Acetobacteraceae bacterium]